MRGTALITGGSMVTAATLTSDLLDVRDGVKMNSGTVSQATDINTGVTINAESGVITTQSASTSAKSCDSFIVTNNKVLSTTAIFSMIRKYTGSLIITAPPTAKVRSCLCRPLCVV